MALALAAADSEGIYLATDSCGAEHEMYGLESSLLRPPGARWAVVLGHARPLDVMNGHPDWETQSTYDAALAVREHLSKEPSLSGNHVSALVCGFDEDGSPHCYSIEHDQAVLEPNVPSTSRLSSTAVRAVGPFAIEAVQRVVEAYNEYFPIPRALRCGVNRAFALEEAQIISPWERRLHLPAMVFHLRLHGEMARVL